MRFRVATSADAEAIAHLHADSWRTAYRGSYRDEFLDNDVVTDRLREWTRRFTEPRAEQYVVVAEADRKLAGFACAYAGEDQDWGTLLDNLHVRRDLHRTGTGRRLVAAIGRWTLEQTGGPLYLWVLEQNVNARAFYERLGGVDVGSQQSVPPGGGSVVARRIAWSRDVLPELVSSSAPPVSDVVS